MQDAGPGATMRTRAPGQFNKIRAPGWSPPHALRSPGRMPDVQAAGVGSGAISTLTWRQLSYALDLSEIRSRTDSGLSRT